MMKGINTYAVTSVNGRSVWLRKRILNILN